VTRRTAFLATAVVLVACLAASLASTCTTFFLSDGQRLLYGKNYDWHIRSGMLIVNHRGMAKVAIADDNGNPARWTSTYGSVTFNQFGRDFPMGGMNEVGLVVEVMWLDETRYPSIDDRASIGDLQWVQYQLDTAATVEDVLASDAEVRIVNGAPLHFLVADASGNAATIEFLQGTPETVRERIARYPESTVCVDARRTRRPSRRLEGAPR
jgi:choloylglycine hydrolase